MPTCEACPTCRRPFPSPRVEHLTPLLASALQQIARQTDGGKVYVKVEAYRFKGTHARLALWGLAEELLHPRRSGSGQTRSGFWRPTQKGMQWISGLTHVPSEVFVQGGKVVGLGRSLITWEQAMLAAPTKGKGKARKAIDDEGERLFLAEQAQLEREYLEAD
jgi:hypothetical protein